MRDSEMAQLVEAMVTNSQNLSLNPGVYTVEEKTWLP